MIEEWILSKIEPLAGRPLIVLRDPQRMVQPGAIAVDGWAEAHGYTAPLVHGNLALREMVEAVRDDPAVRLLVVDRSRPDAAAPVYYPDLCAAAGPEAQVTITLRDYLVETTGDPGWPALVDDRLLSGQILADVGAVLRAHRQLREAHPTRFTDTDLYRIILGARLGINPFRRLTVEDVRRVCLEGHGALEDLARTLPAEVLEALGEGIAAAPEPFCHLLEGDATQIIRAYTLALLLRQHGLDHRLLLPALGPELHPYREIDEALLDRGLAEAARADAEHLLADVEDVEGYLLEDRARLALLLRDQLGLDDPAAARRALERERLSPLVRGVALLSLLLDLLTRRRLAPHREVAEILDAQRHDPQVLALRRPEAWWEDLEAAYTRAIKVHEHAARLARRHKDLKVADGRELTLEQFDALWNGDGASRLDYYISDLERRLRLQNLLPAPLEALWSEFGARWTRARSEFANTVSKGITAWQRLADGRFQDLCRLRYREWIRDPQAPAVFTHQFLPRMLAAHWDPQSGRKAVILVFDGLRTDAWEELVRPVLEERFAILESRPGCAILPTETSLSRKAIAAGCLPVDFCSTRENELLAYWLKVHMGLGVRFTVVKDDDTVASGISVWYTSERLDYIVFDFTDNNLHHNTQDLAFIYDVTVREIIRQDVRSIVRQVPDDALVFVTSDHGFTAAADRSYTIPEDAVVHRNDVRYGNARARGALGDEAGDAVLEMDVRGMGIPTASPTVPSAPFDRVLFPRPGYGFRRPNTGYSPDKYLHGGLSLAECLVPMVVMGQPQPSQQALIIEALRQTGSRAEGQPLTVEVTIKALQIAQPETAITLSFSAPEIPPRREVVGPGSATFAIPWHVPLEGITAAEREEQVVRLPLVVTLSYREGGADVRMSRAIEMTLKLDPDRVHRRMHPGLDTLMGMAPRGLR